MPWDVVRHVDVGVLALLEFIDAGRWAQARPHVAWFPPTGAVVSHDVVTGPTPTYSVFCAHAYAFVPTGRLVQTMSAIERDWARVDSCRIEWTRFYTEPASRMAEVLRGQPSALVVGEQSSALVGRFMVGMADLVEQYLGDFPPVECGCDPGLEWVMRLQDKGNGTLALCHETWCPQPAKARAMARVGMPIGTLDLREPN